MFLVCYVISQDHVNLWMRAPVVSHDHGGHWHFISRDIVLVAEEQDSTYSLLNLPLLFISKRHDLKHWHVTLTTNR